MSHNYRCEGQIVVHAASHLGFQHLLAHPLKKKMASSIVIIIYLYFFCKRKCKKMRLKRQEVSFCACEKTDEVSFFAGLKSSHILLTTVVFSLAKF